jgi:glycosyltransferase involved in cell wall biosynthesis
LVEYSFVIPVYNEQDNIFPLHKEINAVIQQINQPCEIIWVDDGSTDKSAEVIRTFLDKEEKNCRLILFDRNYGQSAALNAGFQKANGRYVITLDSDLQNDPADILSMIPYLEQYDMVTGWRKKRHDNVWKKFSSKFANAVRNRLSREDIRDTGCSLKIMNAKHLQNIKMFNGMHRFLPTLMKMEGAQVVEVPVTHRPRFKGTSKYGTLDRAFSGLQDLMAVRWMQDRCIKYNVIEDEE